MPRVLCAYGVGLVISLMAGIGVWCMIQGKLSSVLHRLFPDEEVWRFWEQLIGLSIALTTVSAGIGFSYTEKAQSDPLILTWNFMDHIQKPLEGILGVFLFTFVPLLFAYVIVVRKQNHD
ncbi:MAG: hypothetical protein HYY90_00850 [Candidatus Omnitrophica bacterium]|nr:hypothetical protein [Candidatus Omnitrophota bacterium]MBI3020537.1 hypothetical protein [Candidatus Omnitrophota bacterium]MBI3082906.1 hypothetical protein [Candidatus Omnitrophota bacterium]